MTKRENTIQLCFLDEWKDLEKKPKTTDFLNIKKQYPEFDNLQFRNKLTFTQKLRLSATFRLQVLC